MINKWLIVIGIVLIDQISKFLVNDFVKNTGLAFGLFTGYNFLHIFLILIITAVLIYFLINSKDYAVYGFSFLVGGSLGNLIDRIMLGYVRDFITISVWPSFNFADIFNVIGVIILIKYWK